MPPDTPFGKGKSPGHEGAAGSDRTADVHSAHEAKGNREQFPIRIPRSNWRVVPAFHELPRKRSGGIQKGGIYT